jgi:hypothetical protein
MKIKTSELINLALDYAVAVAEGGSNFRSDGLTWSFNLHGKTKVLASRWAAPMIFCPSTNWAHGGPLIEREKITLRVNACLPDHWAAFIDFGGSCCNVKARQSGTTPLIAGMRALVAAHLGDEVEIPEDLLK